MASFTARWRKRALIVLTVTIPVSPMFVGTAAAENDVTPPTAPSGLRVRDLSFTTATLEWSPSTDDSGWLLYETEVSASGDLQRFAAFEPSKRYERLRQGATYTATVVAVDGAHNRSAPVSIRFTTPVDTAPPTTPTNLRAVTRNGVLEAFEWDASTDNTGQILYTLASEGGLPWRYNSTGTRVTAREILDTCAISPGSTHTVTVMARDASNLTSGKSRPITVTFPG
jgi:hypothetical protein